MALRCLIASGLWLQFTSTLSPVSATASLPLTSISVPSITICPLVFKVIEAFVVDDHQCAESAFRHAALNLVRPSVSSQMNISAETSPSLSRAVICAVSSDRSTSTVTMWGAATSDGGCETGAGASTHEKIAAVIIGGTVVDKLARSTECSRQKQLTQPFMCRASAMWRGWLLGLPLRSGLG